MFTAQRKKARQAGFAGFTDYVGEFSKNPMTGFGSYARPEMVSFSALLLSNTKSRNGFWNVEL